MHAYGVYILHIAYGDAVIRSIPHHLVLYFFPAGNAALQQHLADHAHLEAPDYRIGKFCIICHYSPAGAAQGVGRANNHRKTHPAYKLPGIVKVHGNYAIRHRLTYGQHGILEQLPVLSLFYSLQRCSQQPYPVFFQNTFICQLHRQVQSGLPSQCRQKSIGALPFNNPGHTLPGEGLNVNLVSYSRIGHDGGGVGVDQHHLHPFLRKSLAGLGPGIVKLGGLAYHYRS